MVVDSIRYCVNASRKEDKLQPKNLFQVEENGKEIQMFSFQHVASVPQPHLNILGKFIISSCLFQKQTRKYGQMRVMRKYVPQDFKDTELLSLLVYSFFFMFWTTICSRVLVKSTS